MSAQVVRFRDYERRYERRVDRNPAEPVVIIVLPVVRIERAAHDETCYVPGRRRRRARRLKKPGDDSRCAPA